MATSSTNKIKGLCTFPNYLSSNPEGSLEVAENVVIDADNTLEPRRGQKIVATIPDISKQLVQYNGQILPHFNRSLGYLDNNDPANLTIFKSKKRFEKTVSSSSITIIDHNFVEGQPVYFEKTQDNSTLPTITYFSFPSGLDEVSEFYVSNVVDKDTFQISLSLTGPSIVVGIGKATIFYNEAIDETEPGLRLKYFELNGSLYVTTANGIKKISQLSAFAISNAGGIPALNMELDLVLGSGGFLSPLVGPPVIEDIEVSYRMTWGTKDINGTFVEGVPSQISTIANYTKQSATVNLTILVPETVTTDYFYRIYRTRVSAIGESGDEQRLVIEAPWNGYSTVLVVNDNTSDDIRDSGTPLSSNESSGEGIFQTNNPPPVSKDVAIYKSRAFYANTKSKQKLEITFLGFDGISNGLAITTVTGTISSATLTVGSGHGIAVDDWIALANSGVDGQYQVSAVTSTTITIAADSTQITTDSVVYKSYVTFSKGSQLDRYFFVGRPETYSLQAKAFASVVSSDYFYLTSMDDKIPYYFWFKKSALDVDPAIANKVSVMIDLVTIPVPSTDAEVAIRIKEAIESIGDFSVEFDNSNPAILNIRTVTSGSVTDVLSGTQVGTSLTSITKTQDGFGEDADNQFIRLSTFTSPAQAIEDTAKSLIRIINQDSTNPVYGTYLSTQDSLPGQMVFEERNFSGITFSVTGNSIAVSGVFNPNLSSAVSSNNVGGNVIYFSKFQQPEAVPTVNRFEIGPRNKQILRILGLRDSLFILKEEGIYLLTGENEQNFSVRLFDNSGFLTAPDSAVILNNQIYCVTTQGAATISENGGLQVISRNIENLFNRIGSEDYPNFYNSTFGVSYERDRAYLLYTIDSINDTVATRCYRFNSFTQTWTTFLTPATCGVVQERVDKLFVGSSDGPTIEVERKKLTSRDYADREYSRQISEFQLGRLYLDNTQLVEIGDVLTQRQYFKTTDYNKLIPQLKLDPSLNFDQDFPEMNTTTGAEISNSMLNLVQELNTKDQALLQLTFDAMSDVSSGADTITIANHGLIDTDVVLLSGTTFPSPLVAGNYEVITATTNTFQLRPMGIQGLIQASAYGVGVLTIGGDTLTFNMVRDVDYSTSTILFPDNQLTEGDFLTFTTAATPPTGLVNNTVYEAVNVTPSSFQLRLKFIDLTAAISSATVNLNEVYYASGTLINIDIQKDFNAIVNKLNNSDPTDAQILLNPDLTYPFLVNYSLSEGFEDIDYIIKKSVNFQSYVEIENSANLQLGQITHFKAISSRTIWNYFTLGEPAMLKHVRSGSFLIKHNNLNLITVGYSSDLSGNFENIPFKLDRSGLWGGSLWGGSTWGGEGVAYPLRTLIPKQKQRCRYIKPQLLHASAFRKFSVLGVSFDYEMTSEKTSRK